MAAEAKWLRGSQGFFSPGRIGNYPTKTGILIGLSQEGILGAFEI
jgi:hypothetical protein